MFTLIKKINFEMAHKLMTSYSDECQAIHGHSYTLEVILKSEILDQDGMVMDLKLLGEIVKEMVIKDLDHRLIICQDDPSFGILKHMEGMKITSTAYNPTAENMAQDIHDILYPEFATKLPALFSLTIRLHETATGAVEYIRS